MTIAAGRPIKAIELTALAQQAAEDEIAALGYQDWTPSLSNLTQGSGTIVARYMRIGDGVWWNFRFVYGSGSAVGTQPGFSLPVAPATRYNSGAIPVGEAHYLDSGTGRWEGIVHNGTGSTTVIYYATEAGGGSGTNITSSAPFTWTTNDEISAWGFYEVV